jgi:hypothetical protein
MKKTIYILICIISVLLGVSILFISKYQKLKIEVNQLQTNLSMAHRYNDSLEFISQKQDLLIKIDNWLLESISIEKNISPDTLKQIFFTLPVELFNNQIGLRLEKSDNIFSNLSHKTGLIKQKAGNIKELKEQVLQLNQSYEALQSINKQIDEDFLINKQANQNLQLLIDSLSQANQENLQVIELQKNGNTVFYIGAKVNGQPHGYGVGLWSTGGIYKGEWKQGLRDGKGFYAWKDGEVYEGEWKQGMRTGKGKYVWKDKQYYIGEWKENKRNGFGSIYYPTGKLEYEGNWDNDKFLQPNKNLAGNNQQTKK